MNLWVLTKTVGPMKAVGPLFTLVGLLVNKETYGHTWRKFEVILKMLLLTSKMSFVTQSQWRILY